MNIIEAMRDRDLFAKFFKPHGLLRTDSWKNWRLFLSALFGLPLEGDALETFERHTGRSDRPRSAFREAFVVVGRRGGKSLIAALVAVFLACFRDYTDILVGGEVGVVMLLAADRRQARTILNYINAFLSIPVLSSMVVSRLKESIELNNRVRIEIHTSSFRAVRGYTIVAAICDEVAFWPTDETANPDVEVLNALRPAMATVPDALLLAISSPYARRGALWEMYREHYGKPSEVLVWKASSREMNPSLSSAVVAAAYLRDAASARAEYGGEFREDIESFLSIETIESCVIRSVSERPFFSAHKYIAFCDPSGGRSDSMTLAIAHADREKAVLDLVRVSSPPFSPEQVVSDFAETLRAYRVSEVTGDRYAGEWPREQFAKRRISYRVADKSKSEIYLEFLPLLTSRRIELLDIARLKHELVGLERRTVRGGRDSIDHASGGHDDVANSVAGAMVELLGGHGVVLTYANAVLDAVKKFGNEWREHLGAGDEPEAKAVAPGDLGVSSCPKCRAPCIVRRGPIMHCAQCAHEWDVPGAKSDPVGQRRDALLNLPNIRVPERSSRDPRWR